MADDTTLLTQYAPYVYFHSEEDYFSSSVEWYLNQTQLVNSSGDVQLDGKAPTVAQLTPTSFHQYKRWYLQVPDDNQKKCYAGQKPTNGVAAGCYAYVQTSGSNKYLYYWFFYPFNGSILDSDENKGAFAALQGIEGLAKLLGKKTFGGDTSGLMDLHEGDWEHIIVSLDSDDNPQEVYLAQHASGSKVSWSEIGKYTDTATNLEHPIVYCARHSHATYPTSGEHADPSLPSPFNELPADITVHDLTNEGTPWATWQDSKLCILPYDQNGPSSSGFSNWQVSADQGWLKYSGYYGRFYAKGSPVSDSTGPPSPPYHSEWPAGVPDFDRYHST